MKRLTTDVFKERSTIKHNGFYNYDLVKYINNRTKVPIICPVHGIFKQKPNNHLLGEGCPECGGKIGLTTEVFKIKSDALHIGFYDYSLVEYTNNKNSVKIICPVHGEFDQIPMRHLKGQGCLKCYNDKRRITIEKFVDRLTIEEEPIEVNGEIQCKCAYCKEYFAPTIRQLKNRINSLSGKNKGECRLYCSNGCKQLCPIYRRVRHYKDDNITKPDTSRPDQLELRKLTLERDNFQCQRCGSIENLICHHFTGVEINPIESADIDNCITLCFGCHQSVHISGQCDVRRQPCVVESKVE